MKGDDFLPYSKKDIERFRKLVLKEEEWKEIEKILSNSKKILTELNMNPDKKPKLLKNFSFFMIVGVGIGSLFLLGVFLYKKRFNNY